MADTTLTTAEMRTLDVAVHHPDGTEAGLGDQFDVSGWDTAVLGITNESGQTYLVGLAVGTTTVHAATKDGTVTGSFSVEVTEGTVPPPPGSDVLVFTFGAPVPK